MACAFLQGIKVATGQASIESPHVGFECVSACGGVGLLPFFTDSSQVVSECHGDGGVCLDDGCERSRFVVVGGSGGGDGGVFMVGVRACDVGEVECVGSFFGVGGDGEGGVVFVGGGE